MPRRLVLAALLLLAAADGALAQPMHVLEARPAAQSVMRGNSQEFFLRFDGPVDHHASRLEILRDGQVVRTLMPRLTAAPDTLFAIAGNLAAGDYVLRWTARAMRDGAFTEGAFGFVVAP